MQQGFKACPQCGNANPSSARTCFACSYNFGARARREPPPILAERTSTTPAGWRAARTGLVLLALFIAIFGVLGSLFVADENNVEIDEILNFDDFEFEPPPPIDVVTPEIEIEAGRRFDARSCTRSVGRWLQRLLETQSRGGPVQDVFTNKMPFPIGSFEFGTTVEVYASARVQRAVTMGELARAIALARDQAAARCERRYGG